MTVGERVPVELDIDGPSAPPRANGELVFSEPWESRVFGVTVALHEHGAFPWDEFRDELVAAIGRWERDSPDSSDYRYYECWLEALQSLLARRRIVGPDQLTDRVSVLRARPAGHDHHHIDEPES
ncbi:MAG TPA: nitrile hydratase accessory protein [Acidimicrobiales bacterium]|jgi:nitrile hydratase accessory protein